MRYQPIALLFASLIVLPTAGYAESAAKEERTTVKALAISKDAAAFRRISGISAVRRKH
jgi:hypothetical protein